MTTNTHENMLLLHSNTNTHTQKTHTPKVFSSILPCFFGQRCVRWMRGLGFAVCAEDGHAIIWHQQDDTHKQQQPKQTKTLATAPQSEHTTFVKCNICVFFNSMGPPLRWVFVPSAASAPGFSRRGRCAPPGPQPPMLRSITETTTKTNKLICNIYTVYTSSVRSPHPRERQRPKFLLRFDGRIQRETYVINAHTEEKTNHRPQQRPRDNTRDRWFSTPLSLTLYLHLFPSK